MKATIKKILVADGKAKGVELENGDIILCDKIISCMGLVVTQKVLPPEIDLGLGSFEDQKGFTSNI